MWAGGGMARIILRRIILWSLAAWAQIWPESSSEGSFCGLWRPGPRYGQNRAQKTDFVDFGGLGHQISDIRYQILLNVELIRLSEEAAQTKAKQNRLLFRNVTSDIRY